RSSDLADGPPPLEARLQAPGGPLGLLAAHGLTASPGPADAHFLQGVANVLAGALLRAGR
ncbi:MAG: hypothetical protein JWN08_2183, partial [Frankiales bacterium]|nr:hypothetical protein [Frankiales bacterium]